ncbi:RNA polymerase sigma factor (sigma-70 family) [Nakamurella sp. UYEF19]|uniref:SigE family RNA polymerase sigma factor n=1 Tax=Nakamurella sp. UYEF19 TaxID=1756392 RepID=UPI00339654C8
MQFEEFLDAELDGLARYARVVSRDRNEAHDLLAESLIKVQKAWPKIAGADSQVAYVRRIITNTLISERRSWVARHIFTTRSGELPDVPADAATARVETRDALDQLLRTLAPRERAAVVLRYYLGLDDRSIAAEMGCSVSSVRSYISRALGTLRITASAVQGWTIEVSRQSAERAVSDRNGSDPNSNDPHSKENRHG